MSLGNYFTKSEARSKIGKRIKTNREFSGVPVNTCGTVVGMYKYAGSKDCGLNITWDGLHLIDGFSKDEYEAFLEEI